MKVLIVGSGGREHALAWKIGQSPKLKKLYCAPGNGGMAGLAECVNIKVEDIAGLLDFARREKIDLTVVGPEVPLVGGIVDAFEAWGLKIFGPGREAARLEGSKVFAKEFMSRWNIPTAVFKSFTDARAAEKYLGQAQFPLVIKADGLAAGKGVFICGKLEEALSALAQIMVAKIFKAAGHQVLIEECLAGEEASILAICDGEHYVILDSAQDHKRIFDNDQGPNTGGMGAYSPAPVVTREILAQIESRIIEPVVRGMRQEGHPFKGILYAGVMITRDGPKVLEFNTRFGDPETQAILPRMKSDLLDVLVQACEGTLSKCSLAWSPDPCVCVVMSAGGYPGAYEAGKEIFGLAAAGDMDSVVVFHAGTQKQGGRILTNGGRVLGVTALGADIAQAIARGYQAVEKIHFDHCFFRRDIGARAMRRA